MRSSCYCAWLLLAIACPLGLASARAENFVTVRVWARPEYAAWKAAQRPPKRETYVIAKGEYFDGGCHDTSIEKASFESIVRGLASDLTQQNYYPGKSVREADLLLVVHWGTTIPYISDYSNLSVNNPTSYDPHPGGFATPVTGLDYTNVQSSMRNIYNQGEMEWVGANQDVDEVAHTLTSYSVSGLLRYSAELAREDSKLSRSEKAKTLWANVNEPRYFVILVAFDLPDLLRNHHRKMLWSAHMSMRAPGTNFTLAVPQMSHVAGAFYGQSSEDVQVVYSPPDAVQSKVEIGTIRILGVTDQRAGGK